MMTETIKAAMSVDRTAALQDLCAMQKLAISQLRERSAMFEARLDGITKRAVEAGFDVGCAEDVPALMQIEIERLRADLLLLQMQNSSLLDERDSLREAIDAAMKD